MKFQSYEVWNSSGKCLRLTRNIFILIVIFLSITFSVCLLFQLYLNVIFCRGNVKKKLTLKWKYSVQLNIFVFHFLVFFFTVCVVRSLGNCLEKWSWYSKFGGGGKNSSKSTWSTESLPKKYLFWCLSQRKPLWPIVAWFAWCTWWLSKWYTPWKETLWTNKQISVPHNDNYLLLSLSKTRRNEN